MLGISILRTLFTLSPTLSHGGKEINADWPALMATLRPYESGAENSLCHFWPSPAAASFIGREAAVRSDGGEHGAELRQRERVAGAIGVQVVEGAAVLLGIEAGEHALGAGGRVVHPALNVTPHCSVSAIITEKGGVQGCDAQTLPALVGK